MKLDMTALAAKAAAQKAASLETNGAAATNTNVAGQTIGRNGKPVAQVYANIGFVVPLPQEDGSVVDTFYSSNMGAPADIIERLTASENSSEEWKTRVMIQNAMVDNFEETFADLEPGESVVFDVPMSIEFRRTNPNKVSATPSEDTPALGLFAEAFTKGRRAKEETAAA